jgi:hypothetical protein
MPIKTHFVPQRSVAERNFVIHTAPQWLNFASSNVASLWRIVGSVGEHRLVDETAGIELTN